MAFSAVSVLAMMGASSEASAQAAQPRIPGAQPQSQPPMPAFAPWQARPPSPGAYPSSAPAARAPAPATAPVGTASPVAVSPAGLEEGRWYGWQTLLLDAASIGIFAGSFAVKRLESKAGSPDAADAPLYYTMAATGGALFMLDNSIVHAAHGRFGAMGRSFGLMVGVPLGLLMLAAPAGLAGAFIGVLGGAGVVIAVKIADVAEWAYEDAPNLDPSMSARPARHAHRRDTARAVWVPSLAPRFDVERGRLEGATLQVGGRF